MTKRSITVNVPQATPKSTTPKTLVVDDPAHRAIVAALQGHKATIDAADAAIDAIRATLDPEVTEIRIKAEGDGQFTKSVHVKGDAVDARYSFKDSYAPFDVASAPDLRRLLGGLYDTLFTSTLGVEVKKDRGEALVAYLTAQGVLDQYVEASPQIQPVKDFRQVRFEVRDQLNSAQNAELDRVVKAIASKPTLNLK